MAYSANGAFSCSYTIPNPISFPFCLPQEIARLDEESRRKRAELAKTVEKAEELSKGVIGSLDQLADHMLAAPR